MWQQLAHVQKPEWIKLLEFDIVDSIFNLTFSDDDIAGLLQEATASPAGAFGARNVAAAFRVVEVMGIEQGRAWGACNMNDFRAFLGLKRFDSFEEWNSDPAVAVRLSLSIAIGLMRRG